MKRDEFHSAIFQVFFIPLCLGLLLGLSACSSPQGLVETGRRDLLYGDPNRALANFVKAAEQAPERLHYSALPESSLTYLGRAYYVTGKLPEARRVLEQAVTRSNEDHVAKLYLGLVLARTGDRLHGLRYIEDGMRGLHDWLDYIDQHFAFSFGKYWDPNKEIRRQIESDLAMIASGNVDWPKLTADAEWLGRQMEVEVEQARRDETYDRFREGEDREGGRGK
jgi:tetratricopeptide (TPR) repeat protein